MQTTLEFSLAAKVAARCERAGLQSATALREATQHLQSQGFSAAHSAKVAAAAVGMFFDGVQ